jgi:D-3-phosphoglycerate dehydrogenase
LEKGDEKVRFTDKETLLRDADVVTLHVPYNQGDPFLLDAVDFERMKPGAILINTARGELIDEAALARRIESGKIGGAGLDVLTGEPGVGPDLIRLQRSHNVVVTPHIGGATEESIEKTELFMAQKLKSYLDNRR